jgi:hypothetical protein
LRHPGNGLPVSGTVKNVTLFIGKIPDNAVGVSGMTMRRGQAGSGMTMRGSAHAPARGRSAARAAAGLGRLDKRPPQEKCCHARLPRRRVQPSPRLQAQRSRLAYNGGKRARMQSLLHDAQNLVVFPAIDPDDALGVEAEAGETWGIAIGSARSP